MIGSVRAFISAWGAALLSTTAGAQSEGGGTEPREPGISIRIYDLGQSPGKMRPLVAGQTPNISKVVPALDLDDRRGDFKPLEEGFMLVADGYLEVSTAGEHEFELTSDDGSVLYVNETLVVDNDGEHSSKTVRGKATLAKGLHPIDVRYFQGVGQAVLRLAWKQPGEAAFSVVPTSALSCHMGEVRVTSPGRKKVIMPLQRGRPGDGQPLESCHPSFDLRPARPKSFEPRVGGMDFLPDGRLVVCTWDSIGAVYILDGVEGENPEGIKVKRIAAGLAEPLGLTVVDDRIYVLQKQELTELVDEDGDEVTDYYRCVCSGWDVTANFHEFAFGLVHKDGYFYANLAIAIDPGGRSTRPQVADRGGVVKIAPDGTYEIVAHGLRTPNGIGIGVDGEIFITDNQGDWLPVSKVVHLHEGAFYGSRAVLEDEAANLPVTPPLVWLPQGEIGNSPSQPGVLVEGPYAGQMIHGDVTHGGLKRVFVEKINGAYQGCVFRFVQGLEAGTNRFARGPDGALYIGGIGSTGNWKQEGKKWFGLERIKYNNKPTFEMLAVRALGNGMEIEFTEPLPEGFGWDPALYYVQQYQYVPTAEYGGPKIGEQVLAVRSANVSSDRRSVFLELDELAPDRVVYLRLIGPWKSDAGRPIWATEAWYTLNAIPADRMGTVVSNPPLPPQNVLTDAEKNAGWALLFDGKTLSGWRGFKQQAMPAGWSVVDSALVRTGAGGDIITNDEFEHFELAFEWKVESGGNSGVFFRVTEDQPYVWSTGPEMQILDNEKHADGENPLTSAGSNYALYAPPRDVSYPPGVFNQARLVVRGSHVEHWLNGEKLLEYELGSDEWTQRVAESKFRDMPHYGRAKTGHVALQDHGDRVSFRNIKIRKLTP